MNDTHRAVLKNYHKMLSKDLYVSEELLGELYQAGIFDKGMLDIIRAEREPDKVYRLLELLPKRGPDAMSRFIAVLEKSYPWLATVLSTATATAKAQTVTQDCTCNCKQIGLPNGKVFLDGVDGDVRKLVAAFVHRQFGQSKRISERDKKSVEKFVADQIQRERTRFQSLLESTHSNTPCSDLEGANDVFQDVDIQEQLFSLHMKMEPFILERRTIHNCDAVDLVDGSHSHHCHQPHSGAYKLMPEDMDFHLLLKEVDMLIRHLEMQEAKLEDSLSLFDDRLRRQPLASLIRNLMETCHSQAQDMEEDRQQISKQLNQIEEYIGRIESLEKERSEHRKQIQAAYLDMAALRQEKVGLLDKIQRLEKDRQQHQGERDRTREAIRLGLVTKPAKTTPRGGSTLAGGGATGLGGVTYEENPTSYGRRPVGRTGQGRPVNAYPGYARRIAGTSRYGIGLKKKPPGTKDGPGTKF